MPGLDLSYATIPRVARLLKARTLSPVELVRAALDRLNRTQAATNAFITVLEGRAMAEARVAEQAITGGGYRGPLHGVPVSIKDIYDLQGERTTCGSAVLQDNCASSDAFSVARLRAAGAIIIGKANMTEFAVELPSPVYGPARNPWDGERSAGLSSSGSGASLVAGVGFASLGTDTGGSIRLPAAFCGCVGIKPTYGRVSRRGVFPLSWSLDHAGPLARTVRDAAIALRAIAGHDPQDETSSARPVPAYGRGLPRRLDGLKVGVTRGYFDDVVDGEITTAFEAALGQLESLGAEVQQVPLEHMDHVAMSVGAIIRPEQAAAHAELLKTKRHLYGGTLGDRLVAASMLPAVTYLQAQRLRRLVMEGFDAALRQVDVIAAPTTPILPYKITEQQPGGAGQGNTIARFTLPQDLTGLPAISLPCGFSRGGLPIGLQLIGRAFEEGLLFKAAHAYEQSTDWHRRRPPL